jgi:hypothetical protein
MMRSLLNALHARMPLLVCRDKCERSDDERVGESGDFAICDRCGASITSKTGIAVRKKEGIR